MIQIKNMNLKIQDFTFAINIFAKKIINASVVTKHLMVTFKRKIPETLLVEQKKVSYFKTERSVKNSCNCSLEERK